MTPHRHSSTGEAPPPPPSADTPFAERTARQRPPWSVIVVDDEDSLRRVVAHILSMAGYDCRPARSGAQALAFAEEHPPDVFLVDVMMPEMDGIELVRRLRGRPETARTPILMVSAVGEEDFMVRAFGAGADDYIAKPFKPAILLARVQRALARGSAVPLVVSIENLPAGHRFDGRYEIVRKIGKGSMAVVYQARELESGAEVALKVLRGATADDPEAIRRFRREIYALSRVSHPNVVRVLDSGLLGEHPYFSMEFVAGDSLSRRIEARGALDPIQAFTIAADVALGLAAIHESGFIHRDVKPQNIFLAPEGRAKIGDLGIALPVDEEKERFTRSGFVIGTPGYLSPEQLAGENLDTTSDLFSLGAVLYEMLAGALPTGGSVETTTFRLMDLARAPMPRIADSGLSETVERILRRVLSRDPSSRCASAREYAEELLKALGPAR